MPKVSQLEQDDRLLADVQFATHLLEPAKDRIYQELQEAREREGKDWDDSVWEPSEESKKLLAEAEQAQIVAQAKVRGIFHSCGATTAQDAILLGCTGLAKFGVSIEDAKFVREHMSGAQFALTCFVPVDRFCLVHEVTGGLQDSKRNNKAQVQRYPEMVEKVSRELTGPEAADLAVMESALRKERRAQEARNVLRGHDLDSLKLPEQWQLHGEEGGVTLIPEEVSPVATGTVDPEKFECPEHGKTLWSCRYCIAKEIIQGDLLPSMLIGEAEGTSLETDTLRRVEDPKQMDALIERYNVGGAQRVVLWAKIAEWTKKLSR